MFPVDKSATDKVEETKIELDGGLFTNIVGEQGKYKTVEDAVNSIEPAQAHIVKLEEELAALKTASAENKTREEILEELRAEMSTTAEQTAPVVPVVETPPAVSTSDDSPDIGSLVSEQFKKYNAEQTESTNVDSVVELAQKAWGQNAESKFFGEAQKNGFSKDMIKELAKTSPAAALHAVGLSAQPQTNSFFGGDLRTSGGTYEKAEKPALPTNWGNDHEVADYMASLQKYEDSKK